MHKLDTQVARAERVQHELDRGLTTFDTLQTMRQEAQRYQPPVRAPEPVRSRTELEPEPQTPRVATFRSEARRPFDRDIIREDAPSPAPVQRSRSAYSRLPEVTPEDDSDMLDKVQMSEMVVANLNEMMRSLTLPKRQVLSLEDDLFGGPDSAGTPAPKSGKR